MAVTVRSGAGIEAQQREFNGSSTLLSDVAEKLVANPPDRNGGADSLLNNILSGYSSV